MPQLASLDLAEDADNHDYEVESTSQTSVRMVSARGAMAEVCGSLIANVDFCWRSSSSHWKEFLRKSAMHSSIRTSIQPDFHEEA